MNLLGDEHSGRVSDAAGSLHVIRVARANAPDESRPYQIVLGRSALARVHDEAWRAPLGRPERDRVVVLADREVWRLHSARLGALAGAPRLEIEGGEAAKTFAVLGDVLEFLARSECSRRSCLVAFGGGSIGDVGGLAASLFKRGIDVLHAPTTLLAQVDASIGGKTAINLGAGKNLAGTFHTPCAVCADTELLATLPEREFRSGLGEIAKSALHGGKRELARLETRATALAARDQDAVFEAATDAITVKACIVAGDPFERDGRRALNLGHTFGHAFEHAAGYGVLPHGQAVAAGIGLALAVSARTGALEDRDLPRRFAALAEALGLASDLGALRARYGAPLPVDAVLRGLAHDKKGVVGAAEFVLVRRAGSLVLGVPVPASVLAELLVG